MAYISNADRNYEEKFKSKFKKEGLNVIKVRLDKGVDVNSLNEFGKSMLSYAAVVGSLEMTEYLCENGADVHIENADGTKPLHIATCHDRLDVVKFYISKGVSPNICDKEQNTPLHYLSNHLPIFPNINRGTFREVVDFLVNSGADINLVNSSDCTPLLSAAQKQHHYLVQLFLTFGANVDVRDKKGWTIFHFACAFGWLEVVRSLVENTFIIDLNQATSDGFTPLYLAAKHSHRDIVLLFMHLGANVSWRNNSKVTFLHCCSANGWLDLVQYLVETGFKINVKTKRKYTALSLAANASHLSVVEYLIKRGASYKKCLVETCRRSLLHVACEENWSDIVKFLIENKVNLNRRDEYKDTPLHLALRENNLDIVRRLLEAGANWNLENADKLTAFNECIQDYFNLDVIKMFIDNGAYIQSKGKEEMEILIKEGLVQDLSFCLKVVLNQLNGDLSKVYKIPELANKLPDIDKMDYLNGPLLRCIKEKITSEIQTKGYYNVLNARSILLRSLCVKTIVENIRRRRR